MSGNSEAERCLPTEAEFATWCTSAALLAWVEALPYATLLGQNDSYYDCPLSSYLNQRLLAHLIAAGMTNPATSVSVLEGEICVYVLVDYLTPGSGDSYACYDNDFNDLMYAIDAYPQRFITREMLLSILADFDPEVF